jgi:tRNA pseudouridine55 synthase
VINEQPPSGTLLLDKPPGITSARAVAKVKRLLPKKTKVGHTGTLDPLASGLLVLLIGRATRLSRYVTYLDKTYIATARFGAVSNTLDADGDITRLNDPMPDESTIRTALREFTGDLQQVPPMASALKREGTRLYELRRRGVTVGREARPVTIYSLTLPHADPAEQTATFEVSCSSGTYVRTLISDLAEHLGTGAYLTALRRTRVGHLTVQEAVEPDELTRTTLRNHIIQMNTVVSHLPTIQVDREGEWAVRRGRVLSAGGMVGTFRVQRGCELLALYWGDGETARAEVVLCGG